MKNPNRHTREGGQFYIAAKPTPIHSCGSSAKNLPGADAASHWIPAFAGMTKVQ